MATISHSQKRRSANFTHVVTPNASNIQGDIAELAQFDISNVVHGITACCLLTKPRVQVTRCIVSQTMSAKS